MAGGNMARLSDVAHRRELHSGYALPASSRGERVSPRNFTQAASDCFPPDMLSTHGATMSSAIAMRCVSQRTPFAGAAFGR
jgi:hypothetical protein